MEFDFSRIQDTLAAAAPDREAIVWKDRRLTHAQLADRCRRLANYLLSRGVSVHAERSALGGHESGQDHVALYLYNGNEYLEGMFGAWKARAVSFNVNYRYVDEELQYLFDNAKARAVIYHAEFAPRVAAIRDHLPDLEILLQVPDGSGHALLPGAVDYEEALSGASPEPPPVTPTPDDLYIVYTGGTTGMPKGVLWRSADIFVAAMGGRKPDGSLVADYEELGATVAGGPVARSLLGPPFMHAAAQWTGVQAWMSGATLVIPDDNKKLDPADFLRTVERENCVAITIVGDAFARPILDELERGDYDLSGLMIVGSGGAPFSAAGKEAFLKHLPHVTIFDGMGSSETGAQASRVSSRDSGSTSADFQPMPGASVVSEDLTRVLEPGSEELGWLAQQGRVPLGYLGDEEKTKRTFPVIEGTRYAVPGDRARYRSDGTIEMLGRDSATISSGGEKIFAEEVEQAVKHHPAVFDVVVAGRPSERWGQEVVAIVQLREGAEASADSLKAEAEKHIARYKLPKAFVFRDRIQRSPSGKADYRWATAQAEQE